jgi:hypothetical protein
MPECPYRALLTAFPIANGAHTPALTLPMFLFQVLFQVFFEVFFQVLFQVLF